MWEQGCFGEVLKFSLGVCVCNLRMNELNPPYSSFPQALWQVKFVVGILLLSNLATDHLRKS